MYEFICIYEKKKWFKLTEILHINNIFLKDAVEILPQPITVQCIQTDGRLFDFSVFQLNTLNINGNEGIKNIWYQTEQMPLYNICTYEKGVPVLEEYNPEIIKYLLTFYKNQ